MELKYSIIERLIYIREHPEKFSQIELDWTYDPNILNKLEINNLSEEEIKELLNKQNSTEE